MIPLSSPRPLTHLAAFESSPRASGTFAIFHSSKGQLAPFGSNESHTSRGADNRDRGVAKIAVPTVA